METEIGNPIDYDPSIDPLINDDNETNKHQEIIQEQQQQQHFYYPQEMSYPFPQPPPSSHTEKFDLFEKVEKTTWIIAFAVFLLGFFMGKTMQPVILRYA